MPPDEGVGIILLPHETKRSELGIVRRYLLPPGVSPTHDPDQVAVLESKNLRWSATSYGPFGTRTAFLLAEWYWSSTKKSFIDFQNLISIFKATDFSLADAVKVNWKGAFKTLGANQSDLPADSPAWISDDGWISTTLSIDIPFHSRMGEPGTKTFTVGDFHSRSIVSVIKEKLTSKTGSRQFHYYPYKASWKRTADSPDVELYGEAYTSRAFREEHERVQRLPSTFHNKGLERVVVALMFWSDSTQLTSFGGASLWPGYLFFGNESKYPRGRPSEHLGQQIAYFLKVMKTQAPSYTP
jgi:hypothetical protein